MLSDTIESYLNKINLHNSLIEEIAFETFFYNGTNPYKMIRDLKVEIKHLSQYVPKDTIDNAPALLEWNEETMKNLDDNVREVWIKMYAQVEKIKDFAHMAGYIQHHHKTFNLNLVMHTLVSNFSKLASAYTKHTNDDTKYLYDELKEVIKDAQFSKITKKQKEDHEGFEKLKAKYPKFDFSPREITKAEKDVEHLRTEVVSNKQHKSVTVQDEKSLKKKYKDVKKK